LLDTIRQENPFALMKFLFKLTTNGAGKSSLNQIEDILKEFFTGNMHQTITLLIDSVKHIYSEANDYELCISFEDYLTRVEGFEPLKRYF